MSAYRATRYILRIHAGCGLKDVGFQRFFGPCVTKVSSPREYNYAPCILSMNDNGHDEIPLRYKGGIVGGCCVRRSFASIIDALSIGNGEHHFRCIIFI